ncbi:helix-turn-helix transcriptional regulator [Amycolatopsis acididurans]|uniref:helix-turn-helix transcriptional regulator n=1 Tax=Amycolatopsis acididurans TaxID=2724524 RepID=UPI0028AD4302|nr:helix-turn-helix domain-containing protein [Amycolatopsis acididurans]
MSGLEDEALDAVAVLGEKLRRSLYTLVRDARRPVTRDEAADAAGISRKLAAFHLDKLVDAGLLRSRFESGRRVVGRKPKVYEPVENAIQVSIPPRNYKLLADILVEALLAANADVDARDATMRVSHERGVSLGTTERERRRPGRLGPERALTLTEEILDQHGFEPVRPARDCLRLGNCPFHPIAAREPEFVCGLNLAFVNGLTEGLQVERTLDAVLSPAAGECCVELRHRTSATAREPG